MLFDLSIKKFRIRIKNSTLEVVIAQKLAARKTIANVTEKEQDAPGCVDAKIARTSTLN